LPISFDTWYELEILGIDGNVQVYLNGTKQLDYTDPSPILSGSIALETLDSSHVHIDDILVTGEAPPPPPLGYTWVRTGGPSGGLQWESLNNGLLSTNVWALAIDPQNPQVLYAGLGEGAGIFKSTNGGGTMGSD